MSDDADEATPLPTPSVHHPDVASNTQRVSALEKRVAPLDALRSQLLFAAIAGGIFGLYIVQGAVETRDLSRANTVRIAALESKNAADDTEARQRNADERSTREAIVRLTTTVEAMRDEITNLRSAVLSRDAQPTDRRPIR